MMMAAAASKESGAASAMSAGIFGAGMVTLDRLFDFMSPRVTGASAKVRNLEEAKAALEREEQYQEGLMEADEAGGEVRIFSNFGKDEKLVT
jgi:hypothetical protein